MNDSFIQYIKHYAPNLYKREVLISLFLRSSPEDIPTADSLIGLSNDKTNGSICRTSDGFAFMHNGTPIAIQSNAIDKDVPFDIYDEIMVGPKDIFNWVNPKPGSSTIGLYLLNYLMLASVFGDKIEYVNEVWDIGKVEKKIAAGIMKDEISVAAYRQYIDNGYFIGHFGELCVPTVTERSFTTDPAIAKRKKELLEQYKDQLNDPLIIEKIESELIAMDKAWLKDDPAAGFHDANPKKSYGIHRKKLFITVGGIESFDTDGASYNFIKNSLDEGWNPNDMDIIANETRKGSYNRGKETAKGGAQTKFILRVFQDIAITTEDCGTKTTVSHIITKHNAKNYIGRTILVGSKFIVIDSNNVESYIGQEVSLRSPMTCKTPDGLCHVCCGLKFKQAGVNAIGTTAVAISSKFMMVSMKAFHGKIISVMDTDPIAHIV
jgi:hypothetical protein